MTKQFSKYRRKCECSLEQKLRAAGGACVAFSGASLVASVLTWKVAGGRADMGRRAEGERLGIFIGLWVPSLLLLAAYLTRKADDEALSVREYTPFYEEPM